eukprot:7045420-Lingulodinium_polyedra.AAC.1
MSSCKPILVSSPCASGLSFRPSASSISTASTKQTCMARLPCQPPTSVGIGVQWIAAGFGEGQLR